MREFLKLTDQDIRDLAEGGIPNDLPARCKAAFLAAAAERAPTPADPLREALEAAIFVLEKVRVFVTSREQINAPTGVKWFDEEVELCRAALAAKPTDPPLRKP